MYYLRVYDNFHYGDESEAYNHGQYATYEEAITGAKAIVDEFMEWNWRANMRPKQLASLFGMFGEEPVIFPNEPGSNKRFSSYDYAEESAAMVCKKHQKEPYTPENYTPIMYNPSIGSSDL